MEDLKNFILELLNQQEKLRSQDIERLEKQHKQDMKRLKNQHQEEISFGHITKPPSDLVLIYVCVCVCVYLLCATSTL